jgi:hypothetical protein
MPHRPTWPVGLGARAIEMDRGVNVRGLMSILVLTLLAGGCAGTSQENSPASAMSPAAPPVTSPTSDPAPNPLTVAQAGTRYLEIVKPYNTALETFEDAAHAGTPWRDLRPLAGEVARANAAHAQALRETSWPVGVQAPMTALLTEIDLAQRDWQHAANANTADELARAVRSAAAHSGSKPAGQIRTLLGLAPYTES